MKNKFFLILTLIFFIFCFIVFFKGLNVSNIYVPEKILKKNLTSFNTNDFFTNEEISSDEIFFDNKFYILNIWASWCVPCKEEHPILMDLSKLSSIKIIGLNYKDNYDNAKNFINEFGNPYSKIIRDKDGTISIELGAYGVPETYVINKKKIIKKFLGPLNENSIEEIELMLK
tara:strand:+ start:308 stop:826 length:519 start_codon:yes stop_codon:yes gene_type:complete